MSNSICGGSHLNSNDPAAIRKELNLLRTNLCYVMGNFAPSYKVYTALLTQTGTSAPVATVLENTLGVTPSWSYVSAGFYEVSISGGFIGGKTFITCSDIVSFSVFGSPSGKHILGAFGGNTVGAFAIKTLTSIAGALADNILLNTPIEIRVYP